MTIRGIDLFCGGGGSSWGAKDAGVTMVGAVDAWDIATKTYEDNFPTAAGNVVTTRLDDGSGPELFKNLKTVDLIIASPECTHHSIARGSKPRDDESRRSGWYVMPFIEAMKPRWVVLENVTPMQGWPGFEDLIAHLKRCGYRNPRIQTLDASDFGVPQARRRMFVICDRQRDPDEVVPTPSDQKKTARSILDPDGVWATTMLHSGNRALSTIERVENGIRNLGKGKDFLTVYYGSDKAGGFQSLDRPLRTLTTVDRFGLIQWKGEEPTIRMLQVPEIKRGMGLPDEFKLNFGSRRDRVKLMGNGVCAPVMRRVVESLVRHEIAFMAAE
jgi:DNA (cytosine-5)-methyltransferase 1